MKEREMSRIQGAAHPTGTTEQLDYVRIDVDPTGALYQVAVVTHHRFSGLDLPQHVTVYRVAPGAGERDLAAVLSATRRSSLQGALTALATAADLADAPTDPAPPMKSQPVAAL